MRTANQHRIPTSGIRFACVIAAPAFLLALVATGCGSFEEAKFNRPFGVGEDAIFAVPFSEPSKGRWYGESARGEFVAETFKTWVMSHATPNFPEGPGVEQVLKTIRDWRKEQIANEDWKALTTTLAVKYVLFGEIEELSLRKPGTVGILDAYVRVSYRVVNVETARVVWNRKQYTLNLSKSRQTEMPTFDMGVDSEAVEQTLLARLSQLIGQDLYGYEGDGH
jgi:hypothetical protein